MVLIIKAAKLQIVRKANVFISANNILITSTHLNHVVAKTFSYQFPSCLMQRFSNCGPRTTSGPRVLPLWSF